MTLYHLSTPPAKSARAIFAAAQGQKEQITLCESHFLAVTVPPPTTSDHGVLALAAEVLVFTTSDFTLIFVSKVDTTGYLYIDKVPKGKDISKIILSTFLAHLLDARSHVSKVVLSLFARAEDQYLFPGSGKNGAKRVVGDRALVKWWCRALDPVLRSSEFSTTSGKLARTIPTAHVLVAGSETNERKTILPNSSLYDPPDKQRWLWSYPADLLPPNPSAPPHCLIPRLPDDPKTRYLEELDEEVEKHGHWTSIATVAQFWEVMDTRKECAAGRAVGYIWIIFPPAEEITPPVEEPFHTNRHVENINYEGMQINGSETSMYKRMTGDLILNEEQYQIMIDELLQLDFDNLDLAKESTKTWISKGSSFAPSTSPCWGVEIQGRGDSTAVKRKVDDVGGHSETVSGKPAIHVLSAGLVRKKPKAK